MNAAFASAVHRAIRDAMAAQGIDQRSLASRLGVTEARVSQLLSNGNLRLSSVDRILAALQVGHDFTIGAVVTQDEADIVAMLGEAWNAFLTLPIEHPQDRVEFCTIIHDAQARVLMRAGRRRIRLGSATEVDLLSTTGAPQ